jgi:hypothetical protein
MAFDTATEVSELMFLNVNARVVRPGSPCAKRWQLTGSSMIFFWLVDLRSPRQ